MHFASSQPFEFEGEMYSGGIYVRKVDCVDSNTIARIATDRVEGELAERFGIDFVKSITCRAWFREWKSDDEESSFIGFDPEESLAARLVALRAISEQFEQRPEFTVDFNEEDSVLSIHPLVPNCFDVTVEANAYEWTVGCCGWHGHLYDESILTVCILRLFTPYFRIVKETREGELTAAWLEEATEDRWEPSHSIVCGDIYDESAWPIIPRGWIRTYYQNAVYVPSEPWGGIVVGDDGLPIGSLLGEHSVAFDTPAVIEFGWIESR